ncbi:MAG: hypothetical protein IH800_14385 [Myxococcales bacterium]|nr:hypothetical protein [Myxococcales bacterium]
MKKLGNMRASLCLTAVLAILIGAPAALAEEDGWDQERAAKLARTLTQQVSELRRHLKSQAPGSVGATQRQRFALEEDLRLLGHTTKRLARALEQGKGREETRPTARRVGSFLRDTRADAQGAVASAAMLEKIKAANTTIAELAVMYGADPADVALPAGR